MRILFAANERSWGGFFGMIRSELPQHQFEATGRFGLDSLEGYDVLIPTMCSVTREMLETRHLMNRETFSHMKQGAFLINLARGGLVDRDALENALASGKIAGAGLDVFWEEPPDQNDSIFAYNVLATPHIGGSTDVSMQGIVKAVAENIRRIENNMKPLHLKK